MNCSYLTLSSREIIKSGSCLVALIGFCLFFTTTAEAQILVGAEVGGQSQWTIFNPNKTTKELYSTDPFFGFHAGGSVAFRVKKTFFLQSSLLFTRRGKHLDGKIDKSISLDVKYNYLDMPILFTQEIKSKIGKKGKTFKVQLGAGPIISYWLGGKGLLNSADLNENGINPPKYDLPHTIVFGKNPQDVVQGEMNVQNPNRFQLGLNFNVGLVLEPERMNKFILAAQYQIGHSYMSPDSEGDFGLDGELYYYDDLQVRSQSFALSLYYFIDLKLDEKNKGKSTIKLDKIRRKK